MRAPLRPAAERRPVVAIVFRYVHHYRARFFELLRAAMDERGVELLLVVGEPGPRDDAKQDAAVVPWAVHIRNRYWNVAGQEVIWQPAYGHVRHADLVVVEQASRLLFNYALFLAREVGGPPMALWGQGLNVLSGHANPTGEAMKRWMSSRVDWWFAYNRRSVEVVRDLGVAPYRITCVQNATDTARLSALRREATSDTLDELRRELGATGGRMAVFSGSLYSDKRLGFLIDACDRVRHTLPDFELVLIGTGPESSALAKQAASRPWLHMLGALRDEAFVRAAMLGQIMVMPGAAGLAVLDAFALELPLVVTSAPGQGHELDYVEDGISGLVVRQWDQPQAYADAIVGLMSDEDRLDRLRDGCREAAARYTVEAMVENFADGVLRALNDFSVRP